MNIFPEELEQVEEVLNEANDTSPEDMPVAWEWAFDFESNEFLKNDRGNYKVYGKEALKIWIQKMLQTQKQRYSIYSEEYGHDLEELMGQHFDETLMTQIQNELVRALTANPYILDATDFAFERKPGGTLQVSFQIQSIYGDFDYEQEVAIDG